MLGLRTVKLRLQHDAAFVFGITITAQGADLRLKLRQTLRMGLRSGQISALAGGDLLQRPYGHRATAQAHQCNQQQKRQQTGQPQRAGQPCFKRQVRQRWQVGHCDLQTGASRAAKEFFDIGELELDIGRAAVVALAGMGRGLHLAQKRVHLFGAHPAA